VFGSIVVVRLTMTSLTSFHRKSKKQALNQDLV